MKRNFDTLFIHFIYLAWTGLRENSRGTGSLRRHGPLTRFAKLRVAHAPGMPGTFSPPTQVSDPEMHHGTCVTHVPWCISGSLIRGFLWSRWRRKRSRHSRRMRNPQFYVSVKRPVTLMWRQCNDLVYLTPYHGKATLRYQDSFLLDICMCDVPSTKVFARNASNCLTLLSLLPEWHDFVERTSILMAETFIKWPGMPGVR